MNGIDNIANDLFYKVRSRFSGLKLGDENGVITLDPGKARFFDFDYVEDNVPLGHVTVSIAENNSIKVYFSSGITESMSDNQKGSWYGFLKELRQFAKRRLLSFDTRDISKDNLDKRDYVFLSKMNKPAKEGDKAVIKPIGDEMMSESSLYGTKRTSYQKLQDTRLIIKHSKTLTDDQAPGARTRNISALFVENQDGERFKYPFIHLSGARAMQRHVANGGVPYDDIGQQIIQMSEEIAQLKSFSNYVVRNDLMNSDTNGIVERSQTQLENLKETMAKLSRQAHYENFKENFQQQKHPEIPQDVIEDFTEKFTVKNFKEDIKSVFPVLYRLMQEENTLGYDDIVAMTQEEVTEDEEQEEVYDPFQKFEAWAIQLGEESPVTSDDEEIKAQAIKDLQELVSQAFPVGVDGSNAIESLKGIIEDPQLYKGIKDTAKEDPDADMRGAIQQYLELYAPDVLEQLDFGDFDPNAQAAGEEPAAAEAPAEEPQMAGDDPDERNKDRKDDLPFDPDDDASDTDEFGNKIKHRARHLARKGMRQAMDVKEVAEFINSFYDRDTGTFPKGPEGVVVMVGKKFGEQAERVARKFVERMAPHQEQGAEQMQELARIRELAGMKEEEFSYTRTADDVAARIKEKGIRYTRENEKEIIAMIPGIMKDMGIDKKVIIHRMGYDEDFVSDVLDGLEREPDDGPKEPKHPQARDYAEEDSVSESQDDIYTIPNPDMERDAETGREEPDEIEVKVEFSSYDDEFEIDKVFRLDTKEDITDKVSNDRQLYFNLVYDVQQREQGRERDYSETIQADANLELDRIRKLSGIAQGLGF